MSSFHNLYDTLDYGSNPLPDNPDNKFFIWWAQLEPARAFWHVKLLRDWDTAANFKQAETLLHTYLTDQQFGGLYAQLYLDKDDIPGPDNDVKGYIWKVNYHYAMFLAETLTKL